MDDLDWLQAWYVAHCDGDWEHQEGVRLSTVDNPGWRLKVNLAETNLAQRPFDRLEVERTEHDWMHCWVEDETFHAACGPRNLTEVLRVFRAWATG
jgi:hypothetical protein